MESHHILTILNQVRENKGLPAIGAYDRSLRLREDIGFDSLDLAELTVRIEEKFNLDVFADGLIHTAGELEDKISRKSSQN